MVRITPSKFIGVVYWCKLADSDCAAIYLTMKMLNFCPPRAWKNGRITNITPGVWYASAFEERRFGRDGGADNGYMLFDFFFFQLG